jgi:response regulator RpfG family c-di-GMP phosphodiesterase
MTDHTLLFVDDEPNILQALERLFWEEDYTILTAASGAEGLDCLENVKIALVISDQRMPQMDGVEFLRQVKERSPDTIRLLLTGYADINATIAAINDGEVYRYLVKPWNDEELKLVVRQALEQFALRAENERLHRLTEEQNAQLRQWNETLEEQVRERTAQIEQQKQQLALLYRQVRTSFLNATRMVSGLLHAYDRGLGEHARRVAQFVHRWGQSLGLPAEELELLEVAAIFHDLGKVGWPAGLSQRRPEQMTPETLATYRKHPVIGQALVSQDEQFEEVGRLIRHHHEAWDGSGFPDGLRGERIPRGARILALADALDHCLNDRMVGLRSGSPVQRVQDEMGQERGKRFDPALVEALLQEISRPTTGTHRERRLRFSDLRPGMVLSRDLYASSGRLIIARDRLLTETLLNRIRLFHQSDPITEEVYVYAEGQK